MNEALVRVRAVHNHNFRKGTNRSQNRTHIHSDESYWPHIVTLSSHYRREWNQRFWYQRLIAGICRIGACILYFSYFNYDST